MNKVIKRDGSVVKFDENKIAIAISKAMVDVYGSINNKNNEDAKRIALEIKNIDIDTVNIETIQDYVENKLMEEGLNEVAKAYILYREEHRVLRKQKARLYDESQRRISEVMSCKDIINSNANVDEGSFSGKNCKITGEFLKEYALNNLMDKEVAQYHRDGTLYSHDMDNYAAGMHNCIFVDFEELFEKNGGFQTRNGDVRRPNDIMTFFQLVAVVFQCQSQVQYGGIGSAKIDYEGAIYVRITFKKQFKEAFMDLYDYSKEEVDNAISNIESLCGEIEMGNEKLKKEFPKEYKIAYRHTVRRTEQGAESLYHNLNTLESRAGSQVPFTSINFGTDISMEGRLISQSLLKASLNGIGKFHRTSIFPISIFKLKSGVNKEPGTPNYDLKQLALKSTSKRIYPNYVNVDLSHQTQEPTCPDEEACTMGCRTQIGFDVNGMGWKRSGRGNISPITINLLDIGIKHGICLGERTEPDIEGFWKDLNHMLEVAERGLLDRYEWIISQKAKSGFFMYYNGIMKNSIDRKLDLEEDVEECMKHGTLALGYIGIAECMKAMFGKHHGEDQDVYNFAYKVVERIHDYAEEATKRNHLNFSCYATPAEGSCNTIMKKMQNKYGIIEGVTSNKFVTNSHHIPVYYNISIQEKIEKEGKFSKLATGGYIMYVELESTFMNNLKAIEKIVDYAMINDVSYFAINFPIDTCCDCGYSSEINDTCPICGSSNIERLRRVTGYLSTDYTNFNKGKIDEVNKRVKHDISKFV